jgi:hypothetical protein
MCRAGIQVFMVKIDDKKGRDLVVPGLEEWGELRQPPNVKKGGTTVYRWYNTHCTPWLS